MVIKVRRSDDFSGEYRVAGGQGALVVTGIAGTGIVLAQVLITLGVLPALG